MKGFFFFKKTWRKCKNTYLLIQLPLNSQIRHLPWKPVKVQFPFHSTLCDSPVQTRDFCVPGDILIEEWKTKKPGKFFWKCWCIWITWDNL